jgi:hypothetical protein
MSYDFSTYLKRQFQGCLSGHAVYQRPPALSDAGDEVFEFGPQRLIGLDRDRTGYNSRQRGCPLRTDDF